MPNENKNFSTNLDNNQQKQLNTLITDDKTQHDTITSTKLTSFEHEKLCSEIANDQIETKTTSSVISGTPADRLTN